MLLSLTGIGSFLDAGDSDWASDVAVLDWRWLSPVLCLILIGRLMLLSLTGISFRPDGV
jgi:hypothetical protein